MKVILPPDGGDCSFEADTASGVVAKMKEHALFESALSLDEYIEAVARRVRMTGATVELTGTTTDERAASLLVELVRNKLGTLQ
jgi:hypothetical protein